MFRAGSIVPQVAQARQPCWKLGIGSVGPSCRWWCRPAAAPAGITGCSAGTLAVRAALLQLLQRAASRLAVARFAACAVRRCAESAALGPMAGLTCYRIVASDCPAPAGNRRGGGSVGCGRRRRAEPSAASAPALARQQFGKLFGRQRLAEQAALSPVATVVAQKIQLRSGFNPFRHGFQLQAACQLMIAVEMAARRRVFIGCRE